MRSLLVGVLLVGISLSASISADAQESSSVITHRLTSPHQSAECEIRIVAPTSYDRSKTYKAIYLLPVEKLREERYGDPIREVVKFDLANKLDCIFVAPTFSALPWYADHPTDPHVAQEKYYIESVLPFVEREYSVGHSKEHRLLLGFSKSGWGAFTLILRHPDVFGRAAAWDAPLMMAKVGLYGNLPIFATQENFEAYRLTDLFRKCEQSFRDQQRLYLTGYGNFREHHEKAHRLLDELGLQHQYVDGPVLKHDWHSGWVESSARSLLSD